ncbi:hypothetical protein ACI1UM_10670 [Lactococcus petauri]|uniref:hypothetical protein n=1 Tax=Lactococcus petauri TaxID=1940789 RepID=UPI003852887C
MTQRKRKRRTAATLRPLTDSRKRRALQLYSETPNIKQVADRLRVDPLELSNYLNTDRTARNIREIQRDKALGRAQDLTIEAMAEAQAMKLGLIQTVRKQQERGRLPDVDDVKSALTAAKQVQDLYMWTTEQQNTAYREQQILEHYERQQAAQHIAPVAAPLGLDLGAPRDITPEPQKDQ